MRRIVHLSDVHFGTADPEIVELVVAKVNALDPHLVVLSGDLTQRARKAQFIAAKAFLDRLPSPQIVVPGNHDIPAHNLFARFVSPLKKFKRYITKDLTPTFLDEELAVVGINTARSLVIKGGRINDEQIEFIRGYLRPLDDKLLKIVVTHHPFDLPPGKDHEDVVSGAKEAMSAIAQSGGDVLMSGHLHVSNIETTAKRYPVTGGGNSLVIQAGTATSTRVRDEPHSFNLLEFEYPRLTVSRFELRKGMTDFEIADTKAYLSASSGWDKDQLMS